MREQDNSLSPEIEKTLGSVLDQWTSRHRLSAARAEAVRQGVLLEADQQQTELPYEWWKRFARQMTATLWQSVDTRRYLGPSFSLVQHLR